MARAAVKAKQQARAKAQPAKSARARGRRRHSGGGNPNQQLFFVRLRRGQKWLYGLLAVVFAVGFAGIGVGSGGGGLQDLYRGIFGGGGGGNSISKAQDEIRTHPAKGYRDLATAYESQGNNVQAASALRSYLGLRKKDANTWAELASLEESQAQVYANQYQAAQQAAQLADPSAPFQPAGPLGQAIGPNAAYQTVSQQATAQTSQLFQQATTALNAAVSDYQRATTIHPRDATLQEGLATAAENAGNLRVALKAWQKYLEVYPASPIKAQVDSRIKQIHKAIAKAAQQSRPGKK